MNKDTSTNENNKQEESKVKIVFIHGNNNTVLKTLEVYKNVSKSAIKKAYSKIEKLFKK